MSDLPEIIAVKHWLEHTVIELNLCPFAKREWLQNRIRFTVSKANTHQQLLDALQAELQHLDQHQTTETSLIIHPLILQRFEDYNDFLDDADALLIKQGYQGRYQIASFHPQYQFAGTRPEDAENYTNRSPFPLLHLLREASLEKAIANYPDTASIPGRNIRLMNDIGAAKLLQQLNAHVKQSR